MITVNLLPFEIRHVKRTPVPYLASAAIMLSVILGSGAVARQAAIVHGLPHLARQGNTFLRHACHPNGYWAHCLVTIVSVDWSYGSLP